MNVPFHLRKRAVPEPATALLLLSRSAADLLELCARLGTDSLPAMFRVADGFLILLPKPVTEALPCTIRLRSLCLNLLLPADADLVPALLDDEAGGLVRDRGLVFLPGGQVHSFRPDQPISPSTLISTKLVRNQSWQPFPQPRRFAEQIESILLDLPQPPPEEILEAGSSDIGTESPRPDKSGVLDTIAGTVESGVGHGLMGLGKLLGLKSLALIGAGMVASAVEKVPRLSEAVLGRQEAALRDLLRLFREGKLDQALRRALPMGGDGGRGGVAATDARLPIHSLAYSLGSLLGSGGRASVWFGGYDVQRELEAEYRKTADAAGERGDFRRAAFIYGKLLHNFRRAAEILFQGGLYADAALLFLKKLDDRAAAARAFELAGEPDRAVQLYRHLGDHASAGDVLRRAGEEEKAFAEYTIAADLLAGNHDFLAAAELMLIRAIRPDVAQAYLVSGWAKRPLGNSVACAFRLAQLHADCRDGNALLSLVAEARTFFDPPGNGAPASKFYNTVADLVEGPGLADVRDEVRDRLLVGLATKLRERIGVETGAGTLASRFFGGPGSWPSALVSDAQFAVKAAFKQQQPAHSRHPLERIRLTTGTVTAAGSASQTGAVFVGFANGEIMEFRPGSRAVIRLTVGDGRPIHRLSVSPDGQMVLALQVDFGNEEVASSTLTAYVCKHGGWEPGMVPQKGWLAVDIAQGMFGGGEYRWFAWDREALIVGCGSAAIGWPKLPEDGRELSSGIVLPPVPGRSVGTLLLFDGGSVWNRFLSGEAPEQTGGRRPLGWGPGVPEGTGLLAATLSWLQCDEIQLAGLSNSVLYWSSLRFSALEFTVAATHSASSTGDYRAAAIIGPNRVAAVDSNRIDWLRVAGSIQKISETPADLSQASAAFVSPPTSELLIVCSDGHLVCVPLPA